jgi:hypothetical protein
MALGASRRRAPASTLGQGRGSGGGGGGGGSGGGGGGGGGGGSGGGGDGGGGGGNGYDPDDNGIIHETTDGDHGFDSTDGSYSDGDGDDNILVRWRRL